MFVLASTIEPNHVCAMSRTPLFWTRMLDP
jgi:hypothetical protein